MGVPYAQEVGTKILRLVSNKFCMLSLFIMKWSYIKKCNGWFNVLSEVKMSRHRRNSHVFCYSVVIHLNIHLSLMVMWMNYQSCSYSYQYTWLENSLVVFKSMLMGMKWRFENELVNLTPVGQWEDRQLKSNWRWLT